MDLKADFGQAEQFLNVLHSKNEVLMFQTFDDNKTIKDPNLARTLVSTFDDAKSTLEELNRRGAGIFVAVNKFQGNRRRIANTLALNCIFIEADEDMPSDLPIPPTLEVESSEGKYHVYFKISPAHTEINDFRPVMQTLVKEYGSDPNATDVTRVLRIPGFYHLKGNPYMVTTRAINPANVYTWDSLTKAFPPQEIKRPSTKDLSTFKILPQTTKIVDALSFLDPNCSRYEWVNTLASLHNAYQGSDQGLNIAISWSKGEFTDNQASPDNFSGDADVIYNWNSFNESTNQLRTIGSLFFEAQQKGWVANPNNQFSIQFIDEEQDSMLKKIQSTFGIVQMPGGGTRVVRRNWDNGRYVFESAKDMQLALAGLDAPILAVDKRKTAETKSAASIKYVPIFQVWMNSEDKLRFKSTKFEPIPGLYYDRYADDKETIIYNKNTPDILNTYYGTYVDPVASKDLDPTLFAPILDLIKDVACNNDDNLNEYILNWIAHTVQHPNKKTGIMVLLMGEKGTGKSMLAYLIKGLHDPFTYKTSNISDLYDGFNATVLESNFIVAEEATWGGDRSQESKLKDFITCQTMTRKQKYVSDESNTRVYHDIIATANPGHALPEGDKKTERRYLTLSVSAKHKNHTKYFNQFYYEGTPQRHEMLRHFKRWLLDRDISKFVPARLPTTHVSAHAAHNRMSTAGVAFHFLHNAIDDEEIIPTQTLRSKQQTPAGIQFKEIDSINQMWNASDPTEHLLIPSALFKDLFKQFKTQSPSHKLGMNQLYTTLQAGHYPVKQRVNPTADQITQYTHLARGVKCLQIPNRMHTLHLFIDKLGLLTSEDYEDEYREIQTQAQT